MSPRLTIIICESHFNELLIINVNTLNNLYIEWSTTRPDLSVHILD